ncbi:MAG: ribosome biogenesis GTPase Der [Planctomycetes bacterium]|nr:ribosome biogenesis GTPase Der [Planctomycetota bacterium]MCW8135937.1 ribosome biogenesis GTPase Der [Planctomycetota bacterium]
MPKKFKKAAAKRHRGTALDKRAAKAQESRRRRRNAKVVGRRKRKRVEPGENRPAPAPRETAQGKRFTRRQKTAPELGIESHADDGMKLPVVAIVGRPNVGKSSLFNRLAGSRIAIEDPRPGTTRDRVSAYVRLRPAKEKASGEGGDNGDSHPAPAEPERLIELIDTAGIGVVDEQRVNEHVHEQIRNAIASADLVLFVADVKDGVLTLDEEAAAILRRSGRPCIVVANKADDPRHDMLAANLYELGLGEPLPVSARGNRNLKLLRTEIIRRLPPRTEAENVEPPELLLAIVGRRNVGKSTLVNALADDERVIASELEGTTRDSIDVRFSYGGKSFVAIDTAGVRRKQSFEHSVEFFSQSRSFRAIRRASVVVLMLDAREPVTKLDRQLADLAARECKPLIIAINKWDLVKGAKTGEFETYIRGKLNQVNYAPLVFVSAKNRENVFALVQLATELHQQAGMRVGTGELNRLIEAAFQRHHPQPRQNRLGRIFYATQVETFPPKVVLFVNEPDLFPENWRTYLRNRLQQTSPFAEIPIRLKFRARDKVVLG